MANFITYTFDTDTEGWTGSPSVTHSSTVGRDALGALCNESSGGAQTFTFEIPIDPPTKVTASIFYATFGFSNGFGAFEPANTTSKITLSNTDPSQEDFTYSNIAASSGADGNNWTCFQYFDFTNLSIIPDKLTIEFDYDGTLQDDITSVCIDDVSIIFPDLPDNTIPSNKYWQYVLDGAC
jgi:hypothetical protein